MTDWKRICEGLVAQFDFAGCTCTFDSEKCCAFAEAVSAIAMARDSAETPSGSVACDESPVANGDAPKGEGQ